MPEHRKDVSPRLSTPFKTRALENLPPRQRRVSVENRKRTPGLKAENPQFDLLKLAQFPQALPIIPVILPNVIHQCKKKNLKFLQAY